MNIFFIFYKEKKNKNFLKILRIEILKKIGVIRKKRIGKNYLYIAYKRNKKTLKKMDKEINKILQTNRNVNIILSKEIKKSADEIKELSNIIKVKEIYKKNKDIYLINMEQIINKKMKYEQKLPQEQEIFILTKSKTDFIERKIRKMVEEYKTINIVTPNAREFQKLEYELEQKDEIITIINNKKKSLSRAQYIVNVDFNEKEILEYNMNREAIIFNISNNSIINLKNFDGQIINNIQINTPYNNEFNTQDIYTINLQNKQIQKNILAKINANQFKMIGNNGIIEFLLDKNEKKV